MQLASSPAFAPNMKQLKCTLIRPLYEALLCQMRFMLV
ncbi:hypothetical protein LOKVESSMR4R_01566 [Yoonia vestfoldensis]|uniref:Uncharacterized protein n=1 Tax=Yoonia vestfoldensis TaxID=245188 RepID=A0A1Y0EBZ1_9RHOB|nr:hypothetical protein LOKVESSMR4R_01566 [Yoonia vestfoldensis]